MSTQASHLSHLRERALLLKASRQFFDQRGFLEVDCPLLTKYASVDAHIDLIPAIYHGHERRYLHSSPEYGMKRLLSEGCGNIYQLSHVFRDGEIGKRHNPEFMMAEWYRAKCTFQEMIEETVEYIRLFLGPLPYRVINYREAFLVYMGLDYVETSDQELVEYVQRSCYCPDPLEKERDTLLGLILAFEIEPKLGLEELSVLAFYPASQAALAQKRWHGKEEVAERFEVYYKGVELANGYHELTNPIEQRARFHEAAAMRKILGKSPLPIDELFLAALEKGLPDCCGVAVGFDRLMMLRQGVEDIAEILSFGWETA